MNLKTKKIIAREGLVIIGLIIVSLLFIYLDKQQSKKFSPDGYRYISSKEVDKYNLFVENQESKPDKINIYSAIPANSILNRDDYEILAKKVLLRRNNFKNIDWDIFWDVDMDKRFGRISGKEIDKYFKERKKVIEEMKDWGNTRLAVMANISIEHFYKAIEKMRGLSKKLNFYFIRMVLLIFGYPFYWLIRFVIWSIKTLRQRE